MAWTETTRPHYQRGHDRYWPAAGWMDRQLSPSHLPLELNRADVADGRVTSNRVLKGLDIIEHISPRGIPARVDFLSDPLGLQR